MILISPRHGKASLKKSRHIGSGESANVHGLGFSRFGWLGFWAGTVSMELVEEVLAEAHRSFQRRQNYLWQEGAA